MPMACDKFMVQDNLISELIMDILHYAWVLRCSFFIDGHMPEPQNVGRAMVRCPRLFYLNVSFGTGKHNITNHMKKILFYCIAMVLATGSVTLTSCGNDEPEKKDVPVAPTGDPDAITDVLSNTTWDGTVDGVKVTLSFSAGQVAETALGDTSYGNYEVSGNSLTLDLDNSILRNSYGSKYTFTISGNRLVLTNNLGENLVFTRR